MTDADFFEAETKRGNERYVAALIAAGFAVAPIAPAPPRVAVSPPVRPAPPVPAPLPAPPTPPPPAKETIDMPSEPHTNVNAHLKGAARDAVRSMAADDGISHGQAVVKLIELAIEPKTEVSSSVDVGEMTIADLVEELRRRLTLANGAVEIIAEANARAEAAEAQLAALRDKVRALAE